MEDSNSSKPFMVTSSLNFKVTTPSFYNQPKKFASVAPPRPKSQTPPSAPSPTPVGTGVIGRVGDMPPPPPSLCDDFPPPPPPLDDELPAPPPECHTTSTASDAPPPAFPAPPPVADDLPLPAPPVGSACPPTCPSPLPPSPPPSLPPVPVLPVLLRTHSYQASIPQHHQVNANQNLPAAVTPPQPKTMTSSPSSFNQPKKTPPPSTPSPPDPVPIPGGGVPLNMREVEELEKMTKDFIKNMDTHAPVITSHPTEVCGKCGEALSRTQPAVRAMDKLYHSNCFCCMSCHRPLQGMQFYDRDGTPQCEDCYVSSLAVCSRCGERITDRVLKAVGQCFHAQCFRCSACSCILEGAPFITDDNNNPYCVQDYHRRFSPLCVSCNEPIVPAPGSEETVRVVALDKNFHLKCYRCEDCARPLSIEADENGCYPLDGKILCMKCHAQRAKRAAQ
ncbi:hypothetical protein Q5P01_011387 [Channa striata]|uniref:Zyxin n=1 Tax=Channa striata TaxID=64152 RepID=A0AA88MX89_CHASR|nr:hypothetical protein Q5P01_011387 [Channa striata]